MKESLQNLAKQIEKNKNQEKSQAELRKSMEDRFLVMKRITKESMEEYKKALQEELFEDKEGEIEGSGEKRRMEMQVKINALFDKAEKIKANLDSKDPIPQFTEEIEVTYNQESINLDIEQKLKEFTLFYQKNNINLPPNFEDNIKEIWERNRDEIEKAIEQNGFNDILLIPENIPLPDLEQKMTEGYKNATWQGSNFTEGGSFAGAKSPNVDKMRIVLVHKTQNIKDRSELEKTLNIKGQDVNLDEVLSLEDYLIFQRKYFEETGNHLDEDGWTWLSTKSGARLVRVCWGPSDGRVGVNANDLGVQDGHLGARPSRSFF